MSVLQIRRAEPKDHDAVLELWDATGLGKTEGDDWTAITTGPGALLLVAEEDGDLVGTAVAANDGWRAYIYHVAVAPKHQRKGVATIIMAEAERHVYDQGARRIYVMVNEDNGSGLALAAATGYEPNGDVVLVKELSAS
jgi:ribosomal protein S18 acetylase RimI-like enzyme